MTLDLLPHLLDIVSDPAAAEGLILAGGYGLQLKRRYLADLGADTLVSPVPDTRATVDLDLVLRLDIFLAEQESAVRRRLDELGYVPHTPRLQFVKGVADGGQDRRLKVDLLARLPGDGHERRIAVREHRVGSGSAANLHGRATPEAFAVEDSPVELPVSGSCTDGSPFEGVIRVPNAYAGLNMKVAASSDWCREGTDGPRPRSPKHVRDVYLLVAMLTKDEMALCGDVRKRQHDHPQAALQRASAVELFGSPDAPGCAEIRRFAPELDYGQFREALAEVMGLD